MVFYEGVVSGESEVEVEEVVEEGIGGGVQDVGEYDVYGVFCVDGVSVQYGEVELYGEYEVGGEQEEGGVDGGGGGGELVDGGGEVGVDVSGGGGGVWFDEGGKVGGGVGEVGIYCCVGFWDREQRWYVVKKMVVESWKILYYRRRGERNFCEWSGFY